MNLATAKQPSLFSYLALKEVPWSLALVGFTGYFIVVTTYIFDLGTELMALALIGLVFGARKVAWPFPVILMTLYWCWAAVATGARGSLIDNEPLIGLGKVLLVFLVAANVLWNRAAIRFFLVTYLTCFTIYPIRGTLFNYFIYQSATAGRPAWIKLFGNPNDMAALTLLALALAAGFLHKECPRALRIGAFLVCAVFSFVILLTQSRGVFIGMCAFILLFILNATRNRVRAITILSCVAAVVVFTVPPAVWERVAGLKNATSTENIAEMDAEGSAGERWQIAMTTVRVIQDNPFVGVGIGQSPRYVAAYSPELGARNVHNTYLEIACETGFPGLIIFLVLIFSVLTAARRARKKHIDLKESAEWRRLQLLEYGLISYLIAGMWGTYGFVSLLYVYLAVIYTQSRALAEIPAAANAPLKTGPEATFPR